MKVYQKLASLLDAIANCTPEEKDLITLLFRDQCLIWREFWGNSKAARYCKTCLFENIAIKEI